MYDDYKSKIDVGIMTNDISDEESESSIEVPEGDWPGNKLLVSIGKQYIV